MQRHRRLLLVASGHSRMTAGAEIRRVLRITSSRGGVCICRWCCRPRHAKKTPGKGGGSGGVSSLRRVQFSGVLYHKGLLSWTQRYCVVADAQLLCYRSQRDAKPTLSLSLVGRDISYTERMDSSRFSHAVRVSRPGSETHWLYTDTRHVADAWILVRLGHFIFRSGQSLTQTFV